MLLQNDFGFIFASFQFKYVHEHNRLWTWSGALEGIIEMQSFCGTKAIQNKDLGMALKTGGQIRR